MSSTVSDIHLCTLGVTVRLYPTKEQAELINRFAGSVRWTYNKAWEVAQTLHELTGKWPSRYLVKREIPHWKRSHPWLCECDSTALQGAVLDMGQALSNYLNPKLKAESPHFKKKGACKDSYRTQNGRLDIIDGKPKVYLPKIGHIKCRGFRDVGGRLLSVTVEHTKSGKYTASLCYENVLVEKHEPTDLCVGVDVGIKTLAVESTGKEHPNPAPFKNRKDKLARKQRRLSRKKRGSANYEKQRVKVAREYERIANIRRDNHHKVSTHIVGKSQVVVAEHLNVEGMLKNHKLAAHIQDAAFSELRRQLKYKCEMYGRTYVEVDTWFPSSRLCSCCGYKNEDLRLEDREWECPECHSKLDRDLNAAQNILKEGLRQLGLDRPDVTPVEGA